VSFLAKPEAFDLPLSNTALIIVDMQNSYGSPGGFRDSDRPEDGRDEGMIGNNRLALGRGVGRGNAAHHVDFRLLKTDLMLGRADALRRAMLAYTNDAHTD
jgi:hypothetical protein